MIYFNGRRAAMGDDLEPIVLLDDARPGDKIVAEDRGTGFRDGGIHDVEHIAVFAPHVDESTVGVDGSPGDDDSLDELMGVHLHQRAVFACARLGFVRVADDVLGLRRILGHKGPLHAGRETRPATPAQIRFLHFVNDLVRGHLFQRFFKSLIGSQLQRDIDLVGVLDIPTLADQGNFELFWSRSAPVMTGRVQARFPLSRSSIMRSRLRVVTFS